MENVPIEILAHIGEWLYGIDYVHLMTVNREIYSSIQRYARYPISMTEYQEESYQRLLLCKNNIIYLSILPRRENYCIIINYISNWLKNNTEEKILIYTSDENVPLWKNILFKFFPLLFQDIGIDVEGDLKGNRIFLLDRSFASYIFEKVKPALFILEDGYKPQSSYFPCQQIHINHLLNDLRDGIVVGPLLIEKIFCRSFLPFQNYSQRLILRRSLLEVFNKVSFLHDRITLLSDDKEASLNDILSKFPHIQIQKQSSLSGIVLVPLKCNNGRIMIKSDHFNSIFMSENIEGIIYYVISDIHLNVEKLSFQMLCIEIHERLNILGAHKDPFHKFLDYFCDDYMIPNASWKTCDYASLLWYKSCQGEENGSHLLRLIKGKNNSY